jgi:magnesium transporter
VTSLLSEKEATATDFMDQDFLTVRPEVTVAQAKALMLASGLDYHGISYLFVVDSGGPVLGVVDARQILVSGEEDTMESQMTSPVVVAEVDDMREDLKAIFSKYHFRMVPVVDLEDRIQGVVHYNDIMRNNAKV